MSGRGFNWTICWFYFLFCHLQQIKATESKWNYITTLCKCDSHPSLLTFSSRAARLYSNLSECSDAVLNTLHFFFGNQPSPDDSKVILYWVFSFGPHKGESPFVQTESFVLAVLKSFYARVIYRSVLCAWTRKLEVSVWNFSDGTHVKDCEKPWQTITVDPFKMLQHDTQQLSVTSQFQQV